MRASLAIALLDPAISYTGAIHEECLPTMIKIVGVQNMEKKLLKVYLIVPDYRKSL